MYRSRRRNPRRSVRRRNPRSVRRRNPRRSVRRRNPRRSVRRRTSKKGKMEEPPQIAAPQIAGPRIGVLTEDDTWYQPVQSGEYRDEQGISELDQAAADSFGERSSLRFSFSEGGATGATDTGDTGATDDVAPKRSKQRKSTKSTKSSIGQKAKSSIGQKTKSRKKSARENFSQVRFTRGTGGQIEWLEGVFVRNKSPTDDELENYAKQMNGNLELKLKPIQSKTSGEIIPVTKEKLKYWFLNQRYKENHKDD